MTLMTYLTSKQRIGQHHLNPGHQMSPGHHQGHRPHLPLRQVWQLHPAMLFGQLPSKLLCAVPAEPEALLGMVLYVVSTLAMSAQSTMAKVLGEAMTLGWQQYISADRWL